MAAQEAVQRLRVGYRIADPLQYVSVLDMGRLWERLLRRARLPLAYTQGFHPHPRLQFAAPLPVGYLSEAEWLDVYLREAVTLPATRVALDAQCPRGLEITGVETVPLDAPNLQSIVREAEYDVLIWTAAAPEAVRGALETLLARENLPRSRVRKGRPQEYDLRPLIHALSYAGGTRSDGAGTWEHLLRLRARSGSLGSGRPEEVLDELRLAIDHSRICRTRLIWE
jgi:radical SAM-linked protein